MRNWRFGAALLAGWLGASAAAEAQNYPYAPGHAAGASPTAAAPMMTTPDGGAMPHGAMTYPAGAMSSVDGGPPPMGTDTFSQLYTCRPQCAWVRFEYLLWWVKNRDAPFLLTSGSPLDAFPGALGQPGTAPLLGGIGDEDDNNHSGGRATVGVNLGHHLGLDASYFALEQRTSGASFSLDGSPGAPVVLARPVFLANSGTESAAFVAIPGAVAGSFAVELPRRFMGADANLRMLLPSSCLCGGRLTLLAGGRYLNLQEKLILRQFSAAALAPGQFGASLTTEENFTTYNEFYGGQLGVEYEYRIGAVVLQTTGKFGLGNVRQVVQIGSFAQAIDPAAGTNVGAFNNSLLVQPTNAGRFTRDEFGFAPEVTFNVGYDYNEYIRLSVGYTFLYLNNVARPGEQVDRAVNVAALQAAGLPAQPRPGALFGNTDFWAQGLNLGVQVSY